MPLEPVGVAVAVTVIVWVGVPPHGMGAGAGVATAKTMKNRRTERMVWEARMNIVYWVFFQVSSKERCSADC